MIKPLEYVLPVNRKVIIEKITIPDSEYPVVEVDARIIRRGYRKNSILVSKVFNNPLNPGELRKLEEYVNDHCAPIKLRTTISKLPDNFLKQAYNYLFN